MTPSHLQYAESLKADLLTANQPFSAEVVARLLQEREELLAACEATKEAIRKFTETGVMQVDEIGSLLDAAITKARGA